MKFAAPLFFALLAIAGCDDRPDQWDAHVYPDAESDDGVEYIRGFKSSELCRAAAVQRLESMEAVETGTFACGHRCEWMGAANGWYVCKDVIEGEDF